MKTKNSYFSRILVILIAVMMVFTMMPSVAFADVGGVGRPGSTYIYRKCNSSTVA